MARPYTKKERDKKIQLFLEALEESRGMITTSCERAGITRKTLEKWRKELPPEELEDKINNIKAAQKEWVEGKLMTLIDNGNTSATIFWLKCQAGYKEASKLEVEQTGTGTINVKEALEDIKRSLTEGAE